MSSTRVFSETSLKILLDFGNSIDVQEGYRTISFQSISSYNSDDTIEIPDILNSTESLQFCGMQPEIADMLYEKWYQDQQELEPGMLGHGESVACMAKYYIKGMAETRNALWESDDWNEALKSQGISDVTRGRILDPNFNKLRLSRSASEWALDTFELSWEFLDGLDARLKKTKKESDIRSVSPDISTKPSKAIKPSSSLSSTLHSGSGSLKLALEVETPTQVPGRNLLYKGGAGTRLLSIFQPDGSLNLNQIVSTPPVDFHPWHYDLYFSKQREVAVRYAKYVQRRVPPQDPTILTVAVTPAFTASSRQVFGQEWRKLVWCSRNRATLIRNGGGLPEELMECANADTLIGLICGVGHDQIQAMNGPEDLVELKTESGEKGTQVVFQGPAMLQKFKTECQGFVWVASLAFPKKAKHFPAAS